MNEAIQSLGVFLNKFRKFEEDYCTLRINEDISKYTILFNFFRPLSSRFQQALSAKAPYYNIFSVLNIKHYETKVHTPYLKHLLSPEETHQQGRLFFNFFLHQILGERFVENKIRFIQVYEEFPFYNGRIDILIRFKMNDKPFGIVIENKIYHHDEQNQLKRYYEYLTESCNLPVGQYHLVYLTPQQEAPSSHSIDPMLYRKLKSENSISEIGYKKHIAPWLQSLSEKIEPISVKEIIHQYIQTIKSL